MCSAKRVPALGLEDLRRVVGARQRLRSLNADRLVVAGVHHEPRHVDT